MALGFPTTEAVLENIENKPAEERSEEERSLFDDLQELKRINNVKLVIEMMVLMGILGLR